MGKKILWVITIIVAIVSVALFFLPHISPATFTLSAFAFLLIPVAILINLLVLIACIIFTPNKALLPLLVLLFSFPYIKRTIAIHPGTKEDGNLNVLSYNVRVFNVYSHLQKETNNSTPKMLEWIIENSADVKCFQEFFNDNASKDFCSINKLKLAMPYYYFNPFYTHYTGGAFGMAIFSRYPIINKGYIRFKEHSNNHVIYVDIKFGNDTLRIYNMHLQSLHIINAPIIDGEIEKVDKRNIEELLKKIRDAAIMRGKQTDTTEFYLKQSPYKTIICGDLNDTPYSYSYQKLYFNYNNAFEKAGNGLGGTFRGRFPLRIDNEFADKRIDIRNFKVYDSIPYSDHYPIEASYLIHD